MGRIKILALSLLAIAIPATAQTFDFSIGTSATACLSIGNVSYRAVANSAPADYTVRLDAAAASFDIRIQIADTADAADFVFVDDGNAPPACQHGGGVIKNVKIVTTAADLIAAMTTGSETADYRIYVRSRRLAPETAAALFAAARSPRMLAGRAPDRLN